MLALGFRPQRPGDLGGATASSMIAAIGRSLTPRYSHGLNDDLLDPHFVRHTGPMNLPQWAEHARRRPPQGAIGDQRGMWQMLRGEIRRSRTDGKKFREQDGVARHLGPREYIRPHA